MFSRRIFRRFGVEQSEVESLTSRITWSRIARSRIARSRIARVESPGVESLEVESPDYHTALLGWGGGKLSMTRRH